MTMNDYVHTARLESDYKSMLHLTGPVITWLPASAGVDPVRGFYPDKYIVTFNILAPTSQGDAEQHVLEIDCSSPAYPRNSPFVKCKTPVVLHPHFYDYGDVCLGGFPVEEPLAGLCIRLARFLQFDPTMINLNSIASSAHNSWYQSNKHRFPMDHKALPTLPDNVADTVPGFKAGKRRGGEPPALPRLDTGISVPGQIVFKRRNPGNSPL